MVMTRTAKWLSSLQALLPPGQAISREPDANITKLLESLAAMLGTAEQSCEEWLAQYDPSQATMMLADWERLLGLPDCCDAGVVQTLEQRRMEVLEKLTIEGGNSQQYFIAMMARRGVAITIDELGNYEWKVIAPLVNVKTFQVGASRMGERLRTWGDEPMECRIRRLKPAHTHVVFGYV